MPARRPPAPISKLNIDEAHDNLVAAGVQARVVFQEAPPQGRKRVRFSTASRVPCPASSGQPTSPEE